MNIEGKYSISFYSDRLSDSKLKEITDFAILYRDVKNEISVTFNSDLLKYINMSKFDFQKEFLGIVKDRISSSFYHQLIDDVFISYSNKIDRIKKKIVFKFISDLKYELHEKDTKKHRKGKINEITKTTSDTILSKTLTYLAKYGDEKILDWLPSLIEKEMKDKDKRFYCDIIDCINKFGLKRLMVTAISKRQRVLKRYCKNPIEFKKLTFRGVSRLKIPVLSHNRDYNSTIKTFLKVSWLTARESLSIPVKYSKSYHGCMRKYYKWNSTSYSVCVNQTGVRVILFCKEKREYPDNKTNFVGFDVNTKHNLLQASDNSYVDYDRRLFCSLATELKKIDSLKEQDKIYVIGGRRQKKVDHLRREILSNTRTKISGLCKTLKESGYDHAVFENLDKSWGRTCGKTEEDINQNRLMTELHVCSLKNEFDHISRKYDISTSFVHPEYTSQTCSKCGCVDAENRETQEEFKCVECGFECNADLNASINIRNRVASTVLRSELLQKTRIGNGTYEPKSLTRDKVKQVLLSFRKRPPLMDKVDKEFEVNSTSVEFFGF